MLTLALAPAHLDRQLGGHAQSGAHLSLAGAELAVQLSHRLSLNPAAEHLVEALGASGNLDHALAPDRGFGAGDELLRLDLRGRGWRSVRGWRVATDDIERADHLVGDFLDLFEQFQLALYLGKVESVEFIYLVDFDLAQPLLSQPTPSQVSSAGSSPTMIQSVLTLILAKVFLVA